MKGNPYQSQIDKSEKKIIEQEKQIKILQTAVQRLSVQVQKLMVISERAKHNVNRHTTEIHQILGKLRQQ